MRKSDKLRWRERDWVSERYRGRKIQRVSER